MSAEWFAGRLRELRTQAGLTQEQLAEKARVKRDAVARWERGAREPSWSNVIALADALGVSCEAFREEPRAEHEARPGRPRNPAAPVSDSASRTPTRRGRPRKTE